MPSNWTPLVLGYIREVQQMASALSMRIIDDDIYILCLRFCADQEGFELACSVYACDSGRRVLQLQSDDSYGSAFGKVAVHSMDQRVHCWKFKVIDMKMYECFGITEFWDNDVERTFFERKSTCNYAVRHYSQKWSNNVCGYGYIFCIEKGSVVKMELDLKKGKLNYYVDDKSLGTAYNIKRGEDIYYKMAINFLRKGSTVQLMDYFNGLANGF